VPLPPHPTLGLCNYMALSRIFVKVMILSLSTCRKQRAFFDKLAAMGRPISLTNFNLYVFWGLHSGF